LKTEQRFNLLDGARGIAALGVLAAHIGAAPREFVGWGAYWVEFFFVLSGFVLQPTLKKLSQFHTRNRYKRGRRWIKLRFIRFWTVLIPALTVLLTIEIVEHILEKRSGNFGVAASLFPDALNSLVGAIFLTQVFYANSLLWHGVAWSLSVEIWINIIAVLLNAGKNLLRQIILSLVGLTLLIFVISKNNPDLGSNFGAGFLVSGFSLGLFGFFIGMATREYWNFKMPKIPQKFVCLFALTYVVFVFFISRNGQYTVLTATIVIIISCPLVFILASVKNEYINKKIFRVNSFLGESSFGVYLLHPISIVAIDKFFNGALNWLIFFAIAAFFTIVLSITLKKVTETALLGIFKKLLFV
jgi:peptidoglycan/LPS O-acetylase OafA/YrhL